MDYYLVLLFKLSILKQKAIIFKSSSLKFGNINGLQYPVFYVRISLGRARFGSWNKEVYVYSKKSAIYEVVLVLVLIVGSLLGTMGSVAYATSITGPEYSFSANGYSYYNFAIIQDGVISSSICVTVHAFLIRANGAGLSQGEAGGNASIYRRTSTGGHVLVASGGMVSTTANSSALIPTVTAGDLTGGEYLGQGYFCVYGSPDVTAYTHGAQYLNI
jgi:hypothetical protein